MLKPLALLLIAGFTITSCKKAVKEAEPNQIPGEVISKVSNLGFSTENIQKLDNGYLVEGDIILTDEYLNQQPNSPRLIIAQEEQYHTFNLVTGLPRTITVSVSGSLPASVSSAIDAAIARYNAEGLTLTFQRGGTSGGNIHFSTAPSGAGYIAAAGFPSSSGNPYHSVLFNTAYAGWNASTLASICAHEMGHCIGFRHTDYMNRSYSCGGSAVNEGASNVGAIHIPGTPTTAENGSFMLACIGYLQNRNFTANDKEALAYLY